jgi:hypothetical protein
MKKTLAISATVSMLLSSSLCAENIGSLSGDLRLGYQYGKDTAGSGNEVAAGGFLHYESGEYMGVSAGGTLSATYGDKSGDGGYFIHGVSNNIVVLSEAYLRYKDENSEFKIGRQAIDTPFANSDDIGMIKNHFGGAIFSNKSIKDTTITAGFIRSMSTGSGDEQNRFEKLDNGVFLAGVEYGGIENLTLQSWHYDDFKNIGSTYIDGAYEASLGVFDAELGVQYAHQDIDKMKNNIYGAMLSLENKSTGLGIMGAYNKTDGASSDNLYGGGPFFTNVEHTTIADGGYNASAYKVGLTFDTSSIGIKDLKLGVEKLWIDRKSDGGIENFGIIGEYAYGENIALRAYYSDIKDKGDGDKRNLRVFADYRF